MRKIAATIALSGLFVGALALAVVVLTPDDAEAQLCVPETQIRERKVSEGECCCCYHTPPKRTWYYFKEKRHRNPNCTWTPWYYVERISKCVFDATCGPMA